MRGSILVNGAAVSGVIVRLFTELRRRNVLRMAVLYVVAAWLVMQVAGVLVDLDVLPAEVGPWVMAALAIGFPIALIVSWFFDITPEGVVRDAEVPEAQPVLAASGRRTDFIIIAMLAAAVILLLVWEPPASADEALTVLPFESMTGPEEASFSQGVSIELLNLLAQLRKFKVKQPPEASILARFADTQTLAREMGVRWVLKGSVRRAEDRVRIAVQLIDADEGAAIAWSNVFDRELTAKNLFGIQTEIARSITSELNNTLDESEEQRLAAPPTENMEAYTAYLIGRDRLRDRKVADLADAVVQFSRAIELDPNFAGAYSGLADACQLHKAFSGGFVRERCPADAEDLLALAQKAVDLDPELGEAWISLGAIIEIIGRMEGGDRLQSLKEAEEAYVRGLELSPSASWGYLWYSLNLLWQAHLNDAPFWAAWKDEVWQSVLKRGLEIDPLSIPLHYMAGDYTDYAKTPEDAFRHARRIVEIAPDSPRGYERLAEFSWTLRGRADEAIRWAHKAARIDPDHHWFPELTSRAYSALGDYEMALAYLEQANRLFADSERSEIHRARLLLHAGSSHEALEILERYDDNPNALFLKLNILAARDLARGAPEAALSRYESQTSCTTEKESWFAAGCPIYEYMRVLRANGQSEFLASFQEEFAERVSDDVRELVESILLIGNYSKAFELCRFDAVTGDTENALRILEESIALGHRGGFWNDWRFFAYQDMTLDSIRDHPRFQAAIAVIEADMAQQLENVRAMQRRGELPTLDELQAELRSAKQEPGNAGN